MNAEFAEANRRIIARGIRDKLKERLNGLETVLDRAEFETAFYEPESELVLALTSFNAFFDEVVIKGWDYMNKNATTPAAIDGAYTYLDEMGVKLEDKGG